MAWVRGTSLAFAACLWAALGCSAGEAQTGRTAPPSPVVAGAEPAVLRETEEFVAAEPVPSGNAQAQADDGTRLSYSHVAAVVRGGGVVTHVVDVISNDGPAPIDFAYTFPLPSDATVSELAYFSGGKRVRAEAKEKAAAKATFEAAKARGDSATLTEHERGSRFSVNLTPLAAGESRRVELTYVQTLDSFGAQRSFVFPAAHSERRGEPVLDFQVDVEGEADISNVTSLNHAEARVVKLGPKSARVLLSTSDAPLGRDLVVRWSERSQPQQLALRAVPGTDGEPGFGQLDFSFNTDDQATASPPRDFVFLLDTSLSMAGEALEHGKQLVERSLAHLTERDRLALVLFDDQLSGWGALAPASAANKARALSELSAKRAAGLSNIDAAIDSGRELLAGSSNPVLVLITDGQSTVGDKPDQLLPASKPADFSAARVFVALVNYPSRQPALAALFPDATSRFLPSGEAGRKIAEDLAQLVAAPVLENLQVTVQGLAAEERYGAVPARLALGDRVRLVGRLDGVPFNAVVSATLHGKPLRFEQTAPASAGPSDVASLPREWARTKLANLESRFDSEHDPALKTSAIELASKFGLVSSFTSLVATDELSPDRVAPGDPELRIRAPRSASSVVARLPWGGEVPCVWDDAEGLWFGRFLVPRGTADGVHRVPVLVTTQGRTQRRSTLLVRVDSKAPQYRLSALARSGVLEVVAEPEAEVFDKSGDSVRLDLVDAKSVSVELAGHTHTLVRGEAGTWSGALPLPAAGQHALSLVASDYAQNSSRRRHRLRVSKSGAITLAAQATLSTSGDETPVVAERPGNPVATPLLAVNVSALATFADKLVVGTFDSGILLIDRRSRVAPLPGAPRFVNALLAEPDRLQIASAQGLFVLRDGELSQVPLPAASSHVNGLWRAHDGTLWLATSGGLLGLRDGAWRRIDEAHGLPSRIVYAVAEDHDGVLWAGTAAGAVRLADSGPQTFSVESGALPHRWVTALLPDTTGMLVGTYQGGITRLGSHGAEPVAGSQTLWLNPHGIARLDAKLYASSMGGGLVELGRDGSSTRVGALPSRDVTAMQSFNGALWVGTRGGLARLARDIAP
jgi:Ca-activated chloride channel homolog